MNECIIWGSDDLDQVKNVKPLFTVDNKFTRTLLDDPLCMNIAASIRHIMIEIHSKVSIPKEQLELASLTEIKDLLIRAFIHRMEYFDKKKASIYYGHYIPFEKHVAVDFFNYKNKPLF